MKFRQLIGLMLRWSKKSRDYETALVVLVPNAEEHIAGIRRSLDTVAMPAHVTVLYPFVRKSLLTDDVLSRIRTILRDVEPFSLELSEIRWFEERVLYLAPNPASPFQEMTQLVTNEFPDYKPYRGEFAEVIPHVTVAEGFSPPKLREAASAITEVLPIHAEVGDVCLMVQEVPGVWEIHTTFNLGR